MEVVDITDIMFDLVGTPGVDGLSVEQVWMRLRKLSPPHYSPLFTIPLPPHCSASASPLPTSWWPTLL